MQARLTIFIIIAIIFFILSLLIENISLKDASNATSKFQTQMHLVNLSSSLKYEIEKHSSNMLESLLLNKQTLHVDHKQSNINLIINELKTSSDIKDKIELQESIKMLQLRYESFLSSEQSLLKISENKNIKEFHGAIFTYKSKVAKFSNESEKLHSLIKRCVNKKLNELEEKNSKAELYTIISSLIAILIFIYTFFKLFSLNKKYFIEKAHAKEAVKEQIRLTEELKSHTQELKVNVDDKTLALEEKIVELEEATKIKSQFLANMSHEIRTPMNAILGFIQILERTESDNTKIRKFTIIKSAANSLLTIINDILDFSKIESGKLELENLQVNTKKPFKEVAKLFFVKANEKKIAITYSFDENLPRFFIGDPVRLKQVISNLLNNAIKFTPNGGKIRMRVECDPLQKELTCKIIDNGVGISEKNLEKIFVAFSQEDGSTTRKYGGTGLGLSISQNLISLMGGTISVESENGQGSTFSFTIPLIEHEFISKL